MFEERVAPPPHAVEFHLPAMADLDAFAETGGLERDAVFPIEGLLLAIRHPVVPTGTNPGRYLRTRTKLLP